MKIYRIYGVILRYMFVFKHSINRMSDAFYWPLMDLIIWGLTISYIKSFSGKNEHIVVVIISGLLLWLVVWRAQYEISVNLLEELWSDNLVNMFVSPLKFSEWVVSVVLLGFIKAVLSVGFASIMAFILYKVRLFTLGFYLLPFFLLLFVTGWWVGFIVAGLILRYGTKVEQFAWSAIYLLAPFSVIYYPLSLLPVWGQRIAMLLPTSYIFEGARQVIYTGTMDPMKLVYSSLLSIIYFILSLLFLFGSYKKVLEKGLAKLN
jgi:ABC-2 type transport system permease protein